jgi:hypothetical protein
MTERELSKAKWLGKGLYILSLAFLVFGLFGIGWVVWPNPTEAVIINLPEGELAGAPFGETYASLADYTLSVSWPRWLRAGEEGRISVLITEDEVDKVQVADRPVQVVSVVPAMMSLSINPTGQIQAGVGPGQDLALDWQISGSVPGDYPGEVIVSFEFYDEAIPGMVSVPVAVVDIEVKIIRLFGLQSQMVLWFGLIGLVFWGALFVLGRAVQAKNRLR